MTSRFRFAPAVCALLLAAAPAHAELIFESGDAGSFPSSAQAIKSTDPVDIVRGLLGSRNDVDMFRYHHTGGVFVAKTIAGDEFFVSNPMLHLFDSNGKRLLWDDNSGPNAQALLSTPTLAAGTYFLAVTASGNNPLADPLSPSPGWSGTSGNSFGEYRVVVTRDTPEPGSLTLLALGTVGLAGYARRRWKAAPAAA
jgi:hypothetical protein